MKEASFNIEVINGNTDYIYVLRSGGGDGNNNGLNEFAHKMILNNELKCFIPFMYEVRNEYRQLRYSLPKNIILSDYLKNRFTNISAFSDIILSILRILKTAEDYMIERRFILMNPDYMFLNMGSNALSVICLPVNEAKEYSLSEFFRSIVMPANLDNAENGDSFKVQVYQYPFDNESLDSAIEYFSKLSFAKSAAIPQKAPVQPVQREEIKKTEPPIKPEKSNRDFKQQYSSVSLPEKAEVQKKEKKPGLFEKLMSSSGEKKNKPKNEKKCDPGFSNPFGINIPGEKESEAVLPQAPAPIGAIPQPEKKKDAPIFSGLQIPGIPKAPEAPKSSPAISATVGNGSMRIQDDEKTIFETNDDGATQFIDDFRSDSRSKAYLKDTDGKAYEICNEAFTIGRSGNTGVKIDLDIPHKTVSHLHATIYSDGGVYFIVDNNSSNGTFVDNKRIASGERVELTNNCFVRISNIDFTFIKS